MLYDKVKYWQETPIKPDDGRSDFQIIENLPSTQSVEIKWFSKMTKINPGSCSIEKWKNMLTSFINGKKPILRTSKQRNPWIQLNLGQEVAVLAVVFESGLLQKDKSQSVQVGLLIF